ncbi:LEA type 2 family protein [Chitinophaga nivalis]|uniref:LEA type 2 family protein n=1 Tax=Chitinophaga nivalis TaxID=2991709 RepID=A0ABT3IPU9_9BACT|nr:LEA type 2 family protein [Chitinophaga nivalis]MCW3464320.1 LEA type 2 family protein [Chitinophaga nivalis]MCW3485989.1 LEA type 2 family protein [Chitinophaga nivalis]
MKAIRLLLVIFATWGLTSSCEKMKDIQFVRVAGISMDELGMSKSIVRMTLAYYNPNNYKLQLKDADFDLFLDETPVGHSIQDTMIYIPARDTFYFPVRLEVNMANVFQNALSAFSNKEVTIKATGKCKVGKGGIYLPFPIKCETRQALNFF